MLKQSLQYKLLQKLSPQQIQLMKLIQLPTQAFEERLKQEIEENPALDTGKDESDNFDDDFSNEYEDDGFVVNGSQSEDESSSDDDDGECQICKNGGDLIICDGGDEEGGCGDMYHLSCIGRSVVPPGDWICKKCANENGLNVGIEGHEYKAEGDNEEDDEVQEVEARVNNQPLTIDDSDDEEDIVLPKKKRLKRTILEPESDSD